MLHSVRIIPKQHEKVRDIAHLGRVDIFFSRHISLARYTNNILLGDKRKYEERHDHVARESRISLHFLGEYVIAC